MEPPVLLRRLKQYIEKAGESGFNEGPSVGAL